MKIHEKLSIVYIENEMKILYKQKNNLQILNNKRWNIKWMEDQIQILKGGI